MIRGLLAASLLPVLAVLYLAFAPVPIEPVSWDAPADAGLSGAFEVNDDLASARGLDLRPHTGPEDAAIGSDGYLYATTHEGDILRIHPRGAERRVFATVGGRPLGIEAHHDGSLLVANAYSGLQRIAADGTVTTLLAAIDGKPLVYANDVTVALDGRIYLTESSSRFGAQEHGGTYRASLLDIMEHGGHGRVIAYDPATDRAHTLLTGLSFANGIAIGSDQDYLLINETGHYRVLRYWLRGPHTGRTEVLVDNLPGFPDNLDRGLDGRFWIGLIAPRSALLDRLSDRPFLRKVVQRLPAAWRPRARPSSHVIAIDGEGEVLASHQDPAARFPMLTGVVETDDALYLTTLFGDRLPLLDKRDLE